jgi:CheY-like chemotaxis protein
MMHQKILLVDDDPDDHLIFLDAIHELGLQIECSIATNGLEALAYLNNPSTAPSIIFLDLNMPVMNGFEFLQHIKEEKLFSKIPIVIFTTSDNVNDIKRSEELGAKAFFTKMPHQTMMRERLLKMLETDFYWETEAL